MVTETEIKRLVDYLTFWLMRWRNDPVAYVIECINHNKPTIDNPFNPTHQQARIMRAVRKHRFVAVRSGHGIGKTKLLGWLINWYLDCFKIPGVACRVPCTGASEDQLKNILWTEVSSIAKNKPEYFSSLYKVNKDNMTNNESPEEWFAVLRTARKENPDALQGFHQCFFVVDEASGVDDKIFEVARGAMGDPDSMGILTGNPTKLSGYFYNTFHGSRVWHCIHCSSLDTLHDNIYSYKYINPFGDTVIISARGRQTKAWVEDMKDEYGENSPEFKVRVLGEFASKDNELIIPDNLTADAFIRPLVGQTDRKVIMGVDVARSGNDDSAIVIRKGNTILHVESWHGYSTVKTKNIVIARFNEFGVDRIYVDTIGVGGGVYDMLKDENYPVYECDVTKTAPEGTTKCHKLRDWLWWQARQFFRRNPVKFVNDVGDWKKLIKELNSPTYTFGTANGAIKVESKDEMKERGVPSPNLADAFCMTLMYDFTSKTSRESRLSGKKIRKKRTRSFKTV
jgi:hypothetical protein